MLATNQSQSPENPDRMMQDDLTETKRTLEELRNHTRSSLTCVESIASRTDNERTSNGLSFLEVKNHLLLSYLTDLSYIIYRKCSGKSINGDHAVDRLTETRTVLEKMRPIDQKLKYQIEKLIRVVTAKSVNLDDPLRLHANPKNFNENLQDESASEEDSEEDEKESKKTKGKVYVPPKLSAVYYGDETKQERSERLLERARKRALSTSIMQELRQEYNDGPEEIVENRNLHRARENRREVEKTNYEEKYMTRLTVTKKEKHRASRMATMSSLAELAHFEDISALEANPNDFPMKKMKSSRQGTGFKNIKKGKKGFKRKRH